MAEHVETQLARQLHRNLRILAVLSVVFVGALAYAPMKSTYSEWRSVQEDYNTRAEAVGMAPMAIELKQIWKPEIGLTDRCPSCHVAMGDIAPLPEGGPLYGKHPEVHHDVGRMGCTLCHRGQGRATSVADAHGDVQHWEDPMLPKAHLQASCGSCHGKTAKVATLSHLERGAYLFQEHGCQACHTVDGEGGSVGPDLSGVALKGYDRAWHIRHLKSPTAVVEGSKMMSFGHISDADIDSLLTYLDTLVGARKLMQGKAIVAEQGCRGCHEIGGVGGDVGPSLTNFTRLPASEIDYKNIEGPRTRENWLHNKLNNPASLITPSKMPPFHLPPEDEEALITFLMSLRDSDLPLEAMPEETLVAQLDHRRDFAPDGDTLFSTFCSACHGDQGEGQYMDTLAMRAPGVMNLDTLAVASDEFFAYTIKQGRSNRSMPGWGVTDKGLTDDEIAVLLAHLRSARPTVPLYSQVASHTPDLRLGESIFRSDCGGCHGLDGTGTVIAPSLMNPEFLFVADDVFLYETITRGRRNTAMPSHADYDSRALAGIIGWLRSHEATPVAAGVLHDLEPIRPLEAVLPTEPVAPVELDTALTDPGAAERVAGPNAAAVDPDATERSAEPNAAAVDPGAPERSAVPDAVALEAEGAAAAPVLVAAPAALFAPAPPYDMERVVTSVLGVEIQDYQANGSAVYGAVLYGSLCAGCHGETGAGGVGPGITNPDFLASASDGLLAATILLGRGGRPMRPFGPAGIAHIDERELGDLIVFLREQGAKPSETPQGRHVQGDAEAGQRSFGALCVQCHGDSGQGLLGPALNNPQFLTAATDGFLQATIARGRRGTAMRAWAGGGYGFAELEPQEINDIIAYIRSWQTQP